ncbi:beta-ketoacyl-[acyl-carrier-protein] synthase FabY [Pseudohongiella nitratireducens]|uniref:Beta-ketoacyl-[acyl-carrier-protein] synthase FabY n=1 Tax=Pseudohongiella nitratireducens TaxID=1768907 RepID=A0A916QKW6_9GAMM|nr:beta-ketoacyl synthase [Pseudohongiella nitratireducens]MDF1624071.1 beta-ketoacyl synthase [Pseudohongiella nitratireducens]GFZ81193.1 beta-ketoacyl-[acyl-carrier-protein] synthase FabY [Pseudohongiella nitratireducens]|tara:strand:- start:4298 stop:6232 length:1935 start_codon:yes stop_codon:yes gene_type:complete
MTALPVIVGFGGINPAGRSSAHHGYRRLVLDNLSTADARDTKASLASLMGLLHWHNGQWLNTQKQPVELDSYLTELEPILKAGTLIRKLENDRFDPNHIPFHKKARLTGTDGESIRFRIRRNQLPDQIPMGWLISDADDGQVDVEVHNGLDVLTESVRPSPVNAAGQLPSGFDPKTLYQSRNHPRGLQMTVFGASDAIQSLGFDWDQVLNHVSVEQISVYAGSSMSQLDYEGNGGLMQARLLGNRVSSKQLALGFAEMPADFINAYVLGNLGTTGTNAAACATFLYNLRQAIRDIRSGTHRIAVVGTAEAPILPEVIDGYTTMGALVNDKALQALDEHLGLTAPDFRRACRPFGLNAGFTLGESAQFIVLCDDKLALELGANIHGSVNDVFVNADGFKKSISSPGVGNYLTMAQAAAATANVIGEKGLRERSYVQAHGTGTPQNRITESHIFSTMAKNWGIEKWPVTALKTYIGHSLASASADQLVSSLGLWQYGWMPGITTVDQLAEDVHTEGLDFLLQNREVGAQAMDAVILNAKGFGGNNASASVLAPHVTQRMLEKRHGKAAISEWQKKNEAVAQASRDYDSAKTRGETSLIYRFGDQVIDGMEDGAVAMTPDSISIKGFARKVTLPKDSAYADMLETDN